MTIKKKLTLSKFDCMSANMFERWQQDKVQVAFLGAAQNAILLKYSQYTPELVKFVVEDYIVRVTGNYKRNPQAMPQLNNEQWQVELDRHARLGSEFSNKSQKLLETPNWWSISVLGHKQPYQIYEYLVSKTI